MKTRAKASPTNALPKEIRERITRTSHKMLDAIDPGLDRLTPPAARIAVIASPALHRRVKRPSAALTAT